MIKNSHPFEKKMSENCRGDFFDSHCTLQRDIINLQRISIWCVAVNTGCINKSGLFYHRGMCTKCNKNKF